MFVDASGLSLGSLFYAKSCSSQSKSFAEARATVNMTLCLMFNDKRFNLNEFITVGHSGSNARLISTELFIALV